MNKDNNLGRVLALLSLTLLMSFGLYSLPDTLFGYKIKKVDLLSDFKVKEEKLSLDSLKQQLEQADTLQVDSVALRDSIMRSAGIDSAALALRDSLYKAVYAVQGADSLGAHIEDYSLGHIGLQRFFAALKNRRELNRPVYVWPSLEILLSKEILWWPISVPGCRRNLGGGVLVLYRSHP